MTEVSSGPPATRPHEYYNNLNRAQLSYEYLHTNSTTHEFLFGAIVELVDNSRDAQASKMNVFTMKDTELRGERILVFQDDGCGMDKNEAATVMTFGASGKRMDPAMVGQYGNGLKSGAMRMGKDFVLFTKKSDMMTVVFLSRTFHEVEKIDEVIVPMPSFTLDKQPYHDGTPEAKLRFDTELELLLKYSPFKCQADLLSQFDRITSESGTIVMVYNLRLADDGNTELDFDSDEYDIRIPQTDPTDRRIVPEQVSLRAYLGIVYADPRMKIYIQGKKVRTRRIVSCLYKVRQYKFTSNRFKARAEKEALRAKELASIAQEQKIECESKLRDFENRHSNSPGDRRIRAEWRLLRDAATNAEAQAKAAEQRAKEKDKSKNEPKVLTFIFGMNLEMRAHDGCMIYNNGRLIRMYEQVGPQNDGGVKCSGVIGVVDVPYVVLEPTHNKQNFADSKEFRFLLTAMGQHMEQYWKDLNLAAQSGGVLQFWRTFGYLSNDWQDPPNQDKATRMRRFMSVNFVVQCDNCLKWRLVPHQPNYLEEEFPDNWMCKDNPDKNLSRCEISEKRQNFPLGKFEKGQASQEEIEKKRQQVQKNIEKEKAKLQRLAGSTESTTSPRASARQASQAVEPRESRSSRRGRSPSESPSPPPAPARRSIEKPKTKAALRAQLEKERKEREEESRRKAEKERRRKEKEAAERKRKREAELKRKEREEKRKRQAAAAKRTGRTTRIHSGSEEDEDEEEEEEEEEVEESSPSKGRRGRAAASPAKATPAKESPPKKRVARLAEDVDSESSAAAGPATKRTRASDQGTSRTSRKAEDRVETPSSSMNQDSPAPEVSSTTSDREKVERMAKQLRRCLNFFHPPSWKVSKEDLSSLSLEDLSMLELDAFFKAYELSLTNLVNQHRREADEIKKTLAKVRTNSAALMKHFSKDFEHEGNCDTEQVDLLLEECVRQVRQGRVSDAGV